MSFHDLGLSKALLDAIDSIGYDTPTPIQAQSIPIVLMGRDVLGSAQTGTGKTASFTLPMIDILDSGRAKARMPRSLILAPTRELAAQVADCFDVFAKNHKLSKALIIGGTSFSEQDAALDKGVDVLIATPGRLLDHIERGKVMLHDVKILVIDEADRMLDMGFIPDIEKITAILPKLRQTLFYSATLDETIHKIAEKFVINPKIIEVAPPASTAATVEQFIVHATPKTKKDVFRDILKTDDVTNAIIFCNRKRDISTLRTSLERNGLNVMAMHGDMSQSARNEALAKFKANEVSILVASDVAARGIDIKGLSHVFNFDVPTNAEDYVHRIGRTGRAGQAGRAFTMVISDDDRCYLESIEKLIGRKIPEFGEKPSAEGTHDHDNTDITEVPSPKKPKKQKSSKKEVTKNTNAKKAVTKKHLDELPTPPECSGDSFNTTDHVPAFLLRRD